MPLFRFCFALALGLSLVSSANAQLPSAYDLRSVATPLGNVAWVSDIQDQGTAEDCWTFASALAMDSSLLMQGVLPTGSTAPAPMVSSWHLSVANGNPNQIIPGQAFNSNSNWGGFEYMALGYVTRGSGLWTIPGNDNPATHVTTLGGGPVSNAANPANVFPSVISNYDGNDNDFVPNPLTPLLPPTNQPTAWRATKVSILDQGFSTNVALPTPTGTESIGGSSYHTYSYTLGAADPQVQAVKEAILANGAVTTSMNAQYSAFVSVQNPTGSLVPYSVNYVNPKTATGYSDHEVAIIGWNDNYTITSGGNTTTGAWLVQNSWGTNYWNGTNADPNDGTFWAAYDDAVIGRSGVASFQMASMDKYTQTVLQNELGPMEYAGNFEVIGGVGYNFVGSPTGMAPIEASSVRSILTPTTNTRLGALGLATQIANVEVNASIYEWNPGTQTLGSLLTSATFTNDSIGFFLGELPESLILNGGQSYAVQLAYSQGGSPILGAAPMTIGGSGINGYLTVNSGLSYCLNPTTGQWEDLDSLSFTAFSGSGPNAKGGILFLKGYGTVPEPTSLALVGMAAAALCGRQLLRRRRTA
jgi:C1A family cysteine protease